MARRTLSSVSERSINEKIEYFGIVYDFEDGALGATSSIGGTGLFGVVTPNDYDLALSTVPPGATASATYHTHFLNPFYRNPRHAAENFSVRDISSSRRLGLDAYISTGITRNLLYYDVGTNERQNLGPLR